MIDQKYQIETSDHHCLCCKAQIPPGEDYYSAVVAAEDGFARRNYCPECWQQKAGPVAPKPADRDGASGSEGPEGPEGSEGSERHDVPDGDGGDSPVVAPEFFAFWRTRRPPERAGESRRLRFDAQVVLEFFHHIEPDGESSREPEDAGIGETGIGETGTGEETGEAFRSDGDPLSGGLYSPRRRDLRFVLALLLIRKKMLNFEGSALENGREWLKLSERGDPARDYWVENPELSDEELEQVRDGLGELLQMNL